MISHTTHIACHATDAIVSLRSRCKIPSREPQEILWKLIRPFQMICSDYFTYNSKEYVVIVDRYSNWPMVYQSESGAEGLVKRLRETFVTFGIPEELTSDGGP